MRRITTLYRASALTVCIVGTALAFGCGGGNGNSLNGPAPANGRASTTIWTDNTVTGTSQGRNVYRIATVNNADGSVVTYYGTHDAGGLPDSLVVSAHNALSDPNNPTSGLDPTQVVRTYYDLQNRPGRNVGPTSDLPAVIYSWTSPNQVQVGLLDGNGNNLLASTLTGTDGINYTVVRTKAAARSSASAKAVTRVVNPNLQAIFNAFGSLLVQEISNTNDTLIPAVRASHAIGGTSDSATFGGTSYVGGSLLLSLFEKGNPSLSDVSLLSNLTPGLPLSTFVHEAVGVTVSTNVAALATIQNPANPVYGKNFNANNPGLGGTGSFGTTE